MVDVVFRLTSPVMTPILTVQFLTKSLNDLPSKVLDAFSIAHSSISN